MSSDDCGYGKPPREHQFKPGQSGNPKGRPKGTGIRQRLRKMLDEPIPSPDDGRPVAILEALMTSKISSALHGDPRAAEFLIKLGLRLDPSDNETSEVVPDPIDDEIIADFTRRRLGGPQS